MNCSEQHIKLLIQTIKTILDSPFDSPFMRNGEVMKYWNKQVPVDFQGGGDEYFIDFIGNLSCKILNENFHTVVWDVIDFCTGSDNDSCSYYNNRFMTLFTEKLKQTIKQHKLQNQKLKVLLLGQKMSMEMIHNTYQYLK